MHKLFNRATNVNTEIESQNCFDTRGFITAIECEQVQSECYSNRLNHEECAAQNHFQMQTFEKRNSKQLSWT